MMYFQVLGGMVLLVFAGEYLVRGSVSLAKRLSLPPIIIGLTIVAFGTSAPELMVGIDAVLAGAPTLAIGNVVGSNIANIWLVLGVPAVIAPIMCTAPRVKRNVVFMLLSTLLLVFLGWVGVITYLEGLILSALLIGFLIYSARSPQDKLEMEHTLEDVDNLPKKPDSYLVASGFILSGLLGLALGAHFLVDGSVAVARTFGVSEAVIGLTIIAIGTSIPELVTSVVSALRGHSEVAIGNVIGSNLFNILGILGISSLFGNIPIPQAFMDFDLLVMTVAAFSLIPFAVMGMRLGRRWGLLYCAAYGLYLFFLIQSPHGVNGSYATNALNLIGLG